MTDEQKYREALCACYGVLTVMPNAPQMVLDMVTEALWPLPPEPPQPASEGKK